MGWGMSATVRKRNWPKTQQSKCIGEKNNANVDEQELDERKKVRKNEKRIKEDKKIGVLPFSGKLEKGPGRDY